MYFFYHGLNVISEHVAANYRALMPWSTSRVASRYIRAPWGRGWPRLRPCGKIGAIPRRTPGRAEVVPRRLWGHRQHLKRFIALCILRNRKTSICVTIKLFLFEMRRSRSIAFWGSRCGRARIPSCRCSTHPQAPCTDIYPWFANCNLICEPKAKTFICVLGIGLMDGFEKLKDWS